MKEFQSLRTTLDEAERRFELSERVFHMEQEDQDALLRFLQHDGIQTLKGKKCSTASR